MSQDPSIFGVYHHAWKLGGATWIAVDAVRSLCRLGFSPVEVLSVVRPHPEIRRALEATGCLSGYTMLVGRELYMFVLAMRSQLWRVVRRFLRGRGSRAKGLWLDYSTYKPILGEARRRGVKILEYIYFPYEVLRRPELYARIPDELKEEVEGYFYMYRIDPVRRQYLRLLLRIEDRYRRENPATDADAVLTVSRWTAEIVRHIYGGDPIPNEPAVETRVFSRYAHLSYEEREKVVVTIGRISPEKRFELLIEGVSKSEVKPKLRIVGALSRSKKKYYKKLLTLARKLSVNLEIKTNLPREELAKEVGHSLIYVHSTVGEHFGIGVVEGMAAGLPAVVHTSGGPYHDIVLRGEYGLSYTTTEELGRQIDRLVSNPKEWRYYHEKSLQRVTEYTLEKYAERLRKGLRKAGLL